MAESDTRSWPRGLQEIAAVIGPRAALLLAQHLGGVEKQHIPMKARKDHPLVAVIGLEAWRALTKAFGGDHIDIPRGAYLRLQKTRIVDAKGSNREVALKLGCTQRYVRKIRRRVAEIAQQPDLFTVAQSKRP